MFCWFAFVLSVTRLLPSDALHGPTGRKRPVSNALGPQRRFWIKCSVLEWSLSGPANSTFYPSFHFCLGPPPFLNRELSLMEWEPSITLMLVAKPPLGRAEPSSHLCPWNNCPFSLLPAPCLWQAWSLSCKPRSARPILNYDVCTSTRDCNVGEGPSAPPTSNPGGLGEENPVPRGSPNYRSLWKIHISLLESGCCVWHRYLTPVGSLTFESWYNWQK